MTGIAARVLQKYPWIDNDILRQTLLSTAQRKNLYRPIYIFRMPIKHQSYSQHFHGWGLINLNAALKGSSLFDSRLNFNRNKNMVIVNVDDDTGHIYTFSHNIQGDSGLDKTGIGHSGIVRKESIPGKDFCERRDFKNHRIFQQRY